MRREITKVKAALAGLNVRFLMLGLYFIASALSLSDTKATAAQLAAESFDQGFSVLNYLSLEKDARFVVISGGSNQGIVSGMTFKVYRMARPAPGQWDSEPVVVETGTLKATEVQSNRSIANVISQGSDLSQAFFPKFPNIMAGDKVIVEQVLIARKQTALPTLVAKYNQIFEDPKGSPGSFELTEAGKAKLREMASTYSGARVNTLMIEGHTDLSDPSDVSQAESLQRALTVRQFLIAELGFDPERVVAIGFGKSEPADLSMIPGSAERNRRIVLKVMNAGE